MLGIEELLGSCAENTENTECVNRKRKMFKLVEGYF